MTADAESQHASLAVSTGPNGTKKLPLVVMTAAPLFGHTAPMLTIARDLKKRGYEIAFMTSPEFKKNIEDMGAEYFETTSFWPEEGVEVRNSLPVGPPRLFWDFEFIWIAAIEPRSATMRTMLEKIREREPTREVVIVAEALSGSLNPFLHGAPLPKGYTKFPPVIAFLTTPLFTPSIDTAPFGVGLPPDATPSGRARNAALYQMMGMGPMERLRELWVDTMTKCGATKKPDPDFFKSWTQSFDTMFLMCSPSLEYPRSDLDPSIRFIGTLPKQPISASFVPPPWWQELVDNAALPVDQRKKVVPVTQGTVATDYGELLLPAMAALSAADNYIVIIILGVKDAKLPADTAIPANVRVIDYLPYDAVLPFADVFVTNGGQGGLYHAVNNGVPMVVAGQTEDKAEVTARVAYSGLGLNLATQTPTSGMIGEAVAKVLGDSLFKVRATRFMRENRDLDSHAIIDREIRMYAEEL